MSKLGYNTDHYITNIECLLMVRETGVQFQVERLKKKKMVLDTSLLNTQYYKVCIKGKVEQSRERSSTHPHLSVVAIEKGAFGSPSNTVANFTCIKKNEFKYYKQFHSYLPLQSGQCYIVT